MRFDMPLEEFSQVVAARYGTCSTPRNGGTCWSEASGEAEGRQIWMPGAVTGGGAGASSIQPCMGNSLRETLAGNNGPLFGAARLLYGPFDGGT